MRDDWPRRALLNFHAVVRPVTLKVPPHRGTFLEHRLKELELRASAESSEAAC